MRDEKISCLKLKSFKPFLSLELLCQRPSIFQIVIPLELKCLKLFLTVQFFILTIFCGFFAINISLHNLGVDEEEHQVAGV